MSLNFEIFGQGRSSNSKQSGHLMTADWENHCLSRRQCPSFPEGDCLRVTRMQDGFPCELAKHVDCVLRGNQAGFQEPSLVSSLFVHFSCFWEIFVFCSILVPDQGLGCCLIFCVVKCQQVERGCVPIQGIDLKAATCQWARKQLFQTPGMSHLQRAAGMAFCSPTCSLCASLRAADCSLGLVTVTDYRK